ncbi:MAG TPA: hypothetical protein ENG95_03030 [Nitrospirae bacterium]|nr:hypothetical protein BMS3Abin10_02536 [bacterium BMS3Abin10]GBE38288.1 hypothetical protein BMS3Bbin08_00893 [bacterium BMS3Bbin08]HDH50901.1 hypothetical protein [Nitrospirota bacterium]HDK17539.1 hypothetical protein [Nitrospirota bacterium]HDO25605.1 hypothetical protein [Nitrospirota bacterium]
MQIKYYSINDLKVFKDFRDNIRWDVTPKIFMQPRFTKQEDGSAVKVNIDGYMLYVDMVSDKLTLGIMRNTPSMSDTVGYLEDIPQDLLKEALNCTEECVAGMYPLTKDLEAWLKKELGLSE